MSDFLFRGPLSEIDADVSKLIEIEGERQAKKIILIPSESQAPVAVREAFASVFQNIYAEGYPDEATRWMSEAEILDYDARLGFFRRFSDPRYYKGVEYADVLESLARRRTAEVFQTDLIPADQIYVNVQALSGAPANNAVYHALINPGDTIMGMTLAHGGHLSHGAPVHRSGKIYKSVSYSVDSLTERIDYDQVEELARLNKPKVIVAGYSAYPWMVDWSKFQKIARSVGAFLLADIAHVAGLVAAGVYPSPLPFADVVTFTTHKSLCGPRGACILTTNPTLARKIDRAVFPGEQGGPHVNAVAAIAVAMKLAKTDQFKALQHQIVRNCQVLNQRLVDHGFRIPYGGTNTHLTNLDCSSIVGEDGTTLSGDQAARILDLAGIVVNRNTIPGDTSAVDPSGIRLGTPWITQRGFKETETNELADLIAGLLKTIQPFALEGKKGTARRAKVDFQVLEVTKIRIRDLAQKAGVDFEPSDHAYPHFSYIDEKPAAEWSVLNIQGEKAPIFLNIALTVDVEALIPGRPQPTGLVLPGHKIIGNITKVSDSEFSLSLPSEEFGSAAAWLRDLSDGFISFDKDSYKKLPGPVSVRLESTAIPVVESEGVAIAHTKPYFIGVHESLSHSVPLPEFNFTPSIQLLHRTPIYEVHKQLGAKIIPFAGWELPVWYSSVIEEHQAVRQAVGIFDVSHMGIFQVEGPEAASFLDGVVGNDVSSLEIGESCYTHFLDPSANVIDDLLVYRRSRRVFMLVVNAANAEKDWEWLNAVRSGQICISQERPWAGTFGRNAILRDLHDPNAGDDMRVDLALQGPKSREVLLALGVDMETRQRINSLKRTQLCEGTVGQYQMVISRTGYTGENMAFELFVHPEKAAALFQDLLSVGKDIGIKPIGLGARDSLRTEAGLPLYGHEMGQGSGARGLADMGVAEAGFSAYVKVYKPWFIGRDAFLQREKTRAGEVIRFRFNEKGVRMAHHGDPVMDRRGKVIGFVTSCAVDQEGFLTGQAYVESQNNQDGSLIQIFQSAPDKVAKPPAGLNLNDKYNLPNIATIVSRFLKK